MPEFNFSSLTPDFILDAIESTGLIVESGLLGLNSYENRVYQFMAQDRQRYVVKFYRPNRWTRQQIEEEHQFAFELADHDIPLVAPLKYSQSSLLEYQGYLFALYPSVGGRQFEVDNLEQLEWMGRFIGRIHQVGQGSDFKARPSITVDEYLRQPLAILKQSQLVPAQIETAFFTILHMVADKAADLYHCDNEIRLHGDCHPGNILWRDGPTFVDLDDSRMGPAIQDIWMMLSGDRQEQLLQLDTLISAYEEFADFDMSQLSLIEPLRAMRMIHYMGWLARRWQDPAFPRAFPWFSSERYWEEQVLALKEQLSALQEPALSLSPQNFNQ
ncbi:serine/threonine protein kinase [Neptunicella sp. SCSIO 80796]|uniref:serine/threonine protein kinase n=1 Tax=Neptunicella plasticusilytica TaxID=3117012 RepID=UPI003A4E6191